MGAKKRSPRMSEEDLEIIRRAKRIGVSEDKIGYLIGMSRIMWMKIKQEDKLILEIMQTERAKGESFVADKLWSIIENDKHRGQLSAIIFWLKTRAEWKDTTSIIAAVQALPNEIAFTDVVGIDYSPNSDTQQ